MMQVPIFIIGNWKSNKTINEAVVWFQDFHALWKKYPFNYQKVRIILCPGYIHLSTLKSLIELAHLPLILSAQNISPYANGAYTGEVSAEMLKNLVEYSLIGHSERRKYFHESVGNLSLKADQAKVNGIEPIFCVQDEKMQIPKNCKIIGYEPVWAIGTGKPDSPENASRVAGIIKSKSKDIKTVIYGGSVNAENISQYIHMSNIDGVLPGGASLTAKAFFSLSHELHK